MKFAKWIGGGLGWAFFGPIGALLGFVLGTVIDGIKVNHAVVGHTTQNDFIVSLLVLTAAVMKADGKVLKSELDYVKRFFLSQFNEEDARRYLELLRDILKQDIPVRDVSQQIHHYMDYSARLQLLHYLFGISQADGDVHKSEVDLITQIANELGISETDFQSIKAMFIRDAGSAYKVLEITSDASDDEVKKAYRRMAMKYHPDKVSTLGSEVQRAAKEKFQKLNAAYEDIKRQRGIK
jgi:DnaJ like chaperone protein